MNRLEGYLVYLLIPAIPYLLMIYSPETIDPVYQYLFHGKGNRYVWVGLFSILLASLHISITSDARAYGAKTNFIALTKWYLLLVGVACSAYILLSDTVSIQNAFIGVSVAVIAFYLLLTSSCKRNA